MKKIKSFKSLSDLKDIELFQPNDLKVDASLKEGKKEIAEAIAPQVLRSQEVIENKVHSATPQSTLGTLEQEESYQQRLKWINRREEDVSAGESALMMSRKILESERNKLIKEREKLAREIGAHDLKLKKLDQLEVMELELNGRWDALQKEAVTLTTKSAFLDAKEREFKKELATSKRNEQLVIKKNVSLSMAIERQANKLKGVLLELQKTQKIYDTQKDDLKGSKKEIARIQKKILLLEQEIQDSSGGVEIKLDSWSFVDFLVENGASASELGYSGKKIAICGDGPLDKKDFEKLLKSKGFLPVDPLNPHAEVAVVGRNFDEQEVEGQLIARQEKKIDFYSQELLIASIASKQNPLSNPEFYEDLLNEFSVDHPGLLFLMENFEFPWPLANISDSVALEFVSDGLVDQSPLVSVGYRVGIERGLDQDARRTILSNSFAGSYDHLKRWYVDSDEYMARWGNPNSRKRLFQMSHHIHALINSRRSNQSMKYAVQDWKDDLRWLKRFYKPYMGFKWPVLH